MPGCDFTRRDLLRWTAYAAAATPLALTATPAFGATASADRPAPLPRSTWNW